MRLELIFLLLLELGSYREYEQSPSSSPTPLSPKGAPSNHSHLSHSNRQPEMSPTKTHVQDGQDLRFRFYLRPASGTCAILDINHFI